MVCGHTLDQAGGFGLAGDIGLDGDCPAAPSISATSESRRSLRRAATTTNAPSPASAEAVAAPIPLLAPVTRATVSVSGLRVSAMRAP